MLLFIRVILLYKDKYHEMDNSISSLYVAQITLLFISVEQNIAINYL